MLCNLFIKSTGPSSICGVGPLALPPHPEGCVSIYEAMIDMTSEPFLCSMVAYTIDI